MRSSRSAWAGSSEVSRPRTIEAGFDEDNPLNGLQLLPAITAIRYRTGLTQERFTQALRIPAATPRNWEQGPTSPDPVAVAFFRLVNDDPERAFKVLQD